MRVSNAKDTPFLLMDANFSFSTKGTRFVHSIHRHAKKTTREREKARTPKKHFVSSDRQIDGNTHIFIWILTPGNNNKNDVTLPIYLMSLMEQGIKKKLELCLAKC